MSDHEYTVFIVVCYIISVQLELMLILAYLFSPLAVNAQPNAFESLKGQVGDL